MKRFALLFLCMLGLLVGWFSPPGAQALGCPSYFDVDPTNASSLLANKLEAQGLKKQAVEAVKEGKLDLASTLYVQAAKLHPEPLVQASYKWNAACALVAYKDTSNDWRISPKRCSVPENVAGALTLLEEAEARANQDSPYCSKGVDRSDLKRLIGLVRQWVKTYAPKE